MDKLIDFHADILEIYSKHSARAEFKTIGEGIIDAVDRAQEALEVYAAAVKLHA